MTPEQTRDSPHPPAGSRTRTFVLVHGSWQAGWAWDAVRGRLEADGHRVLVPTLPGQATGEDRGSITHEDYAETVLGALEDAGEDRAVLVGHSLGGTVISQVAGRRPDRVAQLIYCAAFVVEDGEAAADVMPAEMVRLLRQLAGASEDSSMAMPWELWRAGFMNTADEDAARRAYERLVPEPFRPAFEPVRLPGRPHRSVPAGFVVFDDDRTMPPGFWHPGMTGRCPGAPVVTAGGDHEAMLTRPGELATALTTVVARLELAELAESHLRAAAFGDLGGALEAMSDDVVLDVINSEGGPLAGLGQVRAGYQRWAAAARCESFTTVRRMYGDNLVVDEGIWQGRFSAPVFGPVRPGRSVRYRVLHVLEFRNGRIARETAWHDLAAISRQLSDTANA
jgi:pimeloyl-ACP methyl ester carboxylesterase/ketosteroid isomerase-like protein